MTQNDCVWQELLTFIRFYSFSSSIDERMCAFEAERFTRNLRCCIQLTPTHILMICNLISSLQTSSIMPTQRSLAILALALAHMLVAANARYERGIHLSDAPENINPDDLYNEMVLISSFHHQQNVDANEFEFQFANVEICRFPWRIYWKLAVVERIPRCCGAKKLRKVSHSSRNVKSHRRKFEIDGSFRRTIAHTTCACRQCQTTSIQENRPQLLWVEMREHWTLGYGNFLIDFLLNSNSRYVIMSLQNL